MVHVGRDILQISCMIASPVLSRKWFKRMENSLVRCTKITVSLQCHLWEKLYLLIQLSFMQLFILQLSKPWEQVLWVHITGGTSKVTPTHPDKHKPTTDKQKSSHSLQCCERSNNFLCTVYTYIPFLCTVYTYILSVVHCRPVSTIYKRGAYHPN